MQGTVLKYCILCILKNDHAFQIQTWMYINSNMRNFTAQEVRTIILCKTSWSNYLGEKLSFKLWYKTLLHNTMGI